MSGDINPLVALSAFAAAAEGPDHVANYVELSLSSLSFQSSEKADKAEPSWAAGGGGQKGAGKGRW